MQDLPDDLPPWRSRDPLPSRLLRYFDLLLPEHALELLFHVRHPDIAYQLGRRVELPEGGVFYRVGIFCVRGLAELVIAELLRNPDRYRHWRRAEKDE